MASLAGRSIVVLRGEESRRVEIRDDGALVEGIARPLHIDAVARGEFRVTDDQRTITVYVAGAGAVRWVFAEGQVYELEVGSGLTPRRRRAAYHEALAAPMPATVIKLLVACGDTVRKGDTLVILEAMKMELPLRAPRDAVVAAIDCREGELVEPGRTLIELG